MQDGSRAAGRLYARLPLPLGLVIFLVQVALGTILYAVFQEYVPAELRTGDAWGGYLLSAYGGARFLSETPTGAISDRIERKLALLIGFAVIVPAIALMGLAGTRWAFLAASALLGLGTAFIWPPAYAISADLYPPQRRGAVIGFLNLCQLLGFGAGALAGAFVVEASHAGLFVLAGVAALSAGVVALVGLPRYRRGGGFTGEPEAASGAGRLPLRAVWTTQIAVLCGLVLLATASVAMVVPAIRPYGDQVLDIDFSTLTLALIPGVILGALLYVPAGYLADRAGRIVPFVLGQGVLLVGLLMVAETTLLPVAALGGAIIFAGNVLTVPAFNAAVMDVAPESHRGTLIGLTVAVSGLGLALGPAAGGAITEGLGPDAAFRLAAVVSLLTAIAVLGYRRAYGATHRTPGQTPA